MSVELPDLSSKYDSDSECFCETICECETPATIESLKEEIKRRIEQDKHSLKTHQKELEYLKKALDVALKQEPIFVYEHCGHCPKKPENN
jgi:hypothetical protein